MSLAGREPGRLDRLDEDRDRVLVAGEVGREPALVADGRRQAAVVEQAAQRVVRLGAPPQRLREARRADRHDHELLQVDRVVGVHAAVHDVHHRHWQHVGVRAADVAVQRDVQLVGGRLGDRQADAEDGVGAESGLVVGAVEVAQHGVDHALVERVVALQRVGDLTVHERHGVAHPLATDSARHRRAARRPRARRSTRRSAPPRGRVPR